MVDGKPRRGRPAGGKPVLTRERIVTGALELAEQEGLEAVTMRGLARRLGVDAMSLYHHVDNRDTLLDRITEHVLVGVELPSPTGALRADVHAMAQAFRHVALRYPRCAPLVLTRQLGTFAALAPVETVLSVLRDAGFPPTSAVHATRSVLAFVIGSLLREVSAGPTFSGADRDGVERRRAELETAGLPRVAEAAPHLAVCDHEEEFAFGLDLLVDTLQRRAAT